MNLNNDTKYVIIESEEYFNDTDYMKLINLGHEPIILESLKDNLNKGIKDIFPPLEIDNKKLSNVEIVNMTNTHIHFKYLESIDKMKISGSFARKSWVHFHNIKDDSYNELELIKSIDLNLNFHIEKPVKIKDLEYADSRAVRIKSIDDLSLIYCYIHFLSINELTAASEINGSIFSLDLPFDDKYLKLNDLCNIPKITHITFNKGSKITDFSAKHERVDRYNCFNEKYSSYVHLEFEEDVKKLDIENINMRGYNTIEELNIKGKYFVGMHNLNIVSWNGNKGKAKYEDHEWRYILNKRVVKNVEITKFLDENGNIVYYGKINGYDYHADSIKGIMEGLADKIANFSKGIRDLYKEHKTRLINIIETNSVTREDYHEITRACYIGIDSFKNSKKISGDSIEIDELKTIMGEKHFEGKQLFFSLLEYTKNKIKEVKENV